MSHIPSISKVVAISGIALAGIFGLSACGGNDGATNDSSSVGISLPSQSSSMSLDQIKQKAFQMAQSSSTPADRSAYGSEVACMVAHSKEVTSVDGPQKAIVNLQYISQVGDYVAQNTAVDELQALMARISPQTDHELQVVNDVVNQTVNSVPEGDWSGMANAQCVAAKQIRAALS